MIFPLRLDAGAHAQVLVRTDAAPPTPLDTDLTVSPEVLANGRLRVELAASGIHQILLDGRPLLAEGGIGLHLRRDESDTWTMTADHFDGFVEAVFAAERWVVEEAGPLRARVRAEGRLGHSWVRWTLSLQRADPRLFIQIETTFGERFRLLQLPIVLAEAPAGRTDGQPAGAVERLSGRAEWPVQGWSRLDIAGLQLALLTQDAYSLSLDEHCWQWTLLRSPKMAWMGDNWEGGETAIYAGRDWHTDQGEHTFDLVHPKLRLLGAKIERVAE